MSDNKDNHGFSVSVAQEIGVNRAIMLQHFRHLQIAFVDGEKSASEIWVKRSRRALTETYPYLSEKEIRGCLDRLERDDYIRAKVDNALNYDRTKSYQLSKKGWELLGLPASAQKANREQKASDKRANGFDKRANDKVTKGPMNIGSCSSIVTSIVEGEKSRFAPPAPAESETLKVEEVKRGVVAPPAEAPAPTHLVKTTGPDSNGVTEVEGIALAPKEIQPWEHSNATTPKELKAIILNYAAQKPDNWRDNVLESGRASNWTSQKIEDCLTDFCAWQFQQDFTRAKLSQYTAGFSLWLKKQPSFEQRPTPGAFSTNQSTKANLNRYGGDASKYQETPLF